MAENREVKKELRTLNNIVKINDKDYKLKITIGFYKKLGITAESFANCMETAEKTQEAFRLALYSGSRKENSWADEEAMDKVISQDDFDDIENAEGLLSDAFVLSMPVAQQNAALEKEALVNEAQTQMIVDKIGGEQAQKNLPSGNE